MFPVYIFNISAIVYNDCHVRVLLTDTVATRKSDLPEELGRLWWVLDLTFLHVPAWVILAKT